MNRLQRIGTIDSVINDCKAVWRMQHQYSLDLYQIEVVSFVIVVEEKPARATQVKHYRGAVFRLIPPSITKLTSKVMYGIFIIECQATCGLSTIATARQTLRNTTRTLNLTISNLLTSNMRVSSSKSIRSQQ